MSIELHEGLPGEDMTVRRLLDLLPHKTARIAPSAEYRYAVQSKIGARWVTVELFATRAAAHDWLKPVVDRCGNSDGLRERRVQS